MSTSSFPNSESKGPLPSDFQRQHLSSVRKRKKRFFSKRPAILVFLVILVLGCAGFALQSVPQTVPQPERLESPSKKTSLDPGNLSSLAAQPVTFEDVQETPVVAALPSPQNISIPAPLVASESESAQDSPILFARVIIENPDSPPVAVLTPTPLPPAPTPEPPLPTPISLPQNSTEVVSATIINMPAVTSTTFLQSAIKHVVIITIDGLRPDALDLAPTPNLDKLRARGAYCPHAQTVLPSKTLPSHAAMLSGMTPEKNGIQWSMPYIGWPGMNGPTLFNVVHDAGLRTAMVFGKEKLNYTIIGNSVDELFGEDAHDAEVKDHAVEIIEAGLPDVMFIHFPDTDRVGHEFGWMSENQFYSITFADAMIGEITAALERGGYMNSTLLIITADHGGHGTGHGDDSPLDRTIPWLAVGPGVPVREGLGTQINTYDTAATALYALNLPIPENWDGKPVLAIFQSELVAATN